MPESFLGVPIIHNQKATGVITIQDLDRKNLYTEKDGQLLLTLASNMGVALENARLFEETKRLLNETQQRNVELAILNAYTRRSGDGDGFSLHNKSCWRQIQRSFRIS